MNRIKKFLTGEDGWVTAVAGIILPLLLLFSAFGLDWGRVYLLKHQLQNVVDAGSLAGASAVEAKLVLDTDGNKAGERLVLDPTLADIYASDVINANTAVSDFERQGVNVLGFSSGSLDADSDGYLESYHAEIEAEIQTFLVGPLTGYGNIIHVTREAQAMARDTTT